MSSNCQLNKTTSTLTFTALASGVDGLSLHWIYIRRMAQDHPKAWLDIYRRLSKSTAPPSKAHGTKKYTKADRRKAKREIRDEGDG